jgi:hypothetical protein
MLRLELHDGHLKYVNGFNASPWSVTRYHGEHWAQIASDLLCGVADVLQDVGIVTVGRSTCRSRGSVKYCAIAGSDNEVLTQKRWVPIDAADRAHKSVYSLSEEHGELYVPNSREAVEEVSDWIMFVPDQEEGYKSIAFPDYNDFRKRLDGKSWNVRNGDLARFVNENCVERAYFYMLIGPSPWLLFPGSIELNQLVRLADPVAARINTELTD